MNPIYSEMQWKNKAPDRGHWAGPGEREGASQRETGECVKFCKMMNVTDVKYHKISTSNINIQPELWVLTTSNSPTDTRVTARSEWGDISGNALTGESLTHRETEMLAGLNQL